MGVMCRSELNQIIKRTLDFVADYKIVLPRFAYYRLADWKKQDLKAYQEVFDLELGWDVSDFGSSNFNKTGCTLLTLRNGGVSGIMQQLYPNPYAEKMLFVGQDQELPMHFHRHKMEDIINRGGGDLLIEMYNSTADEQLDKSKDLQVTIDGRKECYKPGEIICIKPGSGIRVNPLQYHRFWAEKAPVIAWEVSKTNDDHTDNRFLDQGDRFSTIEEDTAAEYVLCNEYQTVLNVKKSV